MTFGSLLSSEEMHSFYDDNFMFKGNKYIVEGTMQGDFQHGGGEWMNDFTVYDPSGTDITDDLSDEDLMDIMEAAEKELAYQI